MHNPNVNPALPAEWSTSLELDVEDVWNGFYIYALILEHRESGSVLELAHNAESQAARLRPALQARNKKMAGTGQEAWNHACELCCWVFTDENGVSCALYLLSFEFFLNLSLDHCRSTVTDGVGIGCPCCGKHDCPRPLPTVKHRFCDTHGHLSKKCAVVDCEALVEQGFRTCPIADHRAIEVYHYQQGKGMFQLKHRLERLKVSQTHDSLATTTGMSYDDSRLPDELNTSSATLRPQQPSMSDVEEVYEGPGADEDEDVEVDVNGICDGKPDTGNRTAKARFGRKRTHNEQLCVGSCGVILGRATFYGSEAPNGVRVRVI